MDSNQFYSENTQTTDTNYVAKYSHPIETPPREAVEAVVEKTPILEVPKPLPPAVRPASRSRLKVIVKILIAIMVMVLVCIGLSLAVKIWNPLWNPF